MAVEPHHIRHVLSDLWEVSAQELRAFGFNPMDEDDRERVIESIEQWRDMADAYAYAVVDDGGDAIVVFGAFRSPMPGVWRTWFVASRDFADTYAKVTATMRQKMRAAAQASRMKEFECWTIGSDERAQRWFKLLGFERDETAGAMTGIGGRQIVRYACQAQVH